MKNILIALLLLLSFNTIKATHYVGGEFSYTRIGNRQYNVTHKVYRDCNGIQFCFSCQSGSSPIPCSFPVQIFGAQAPSGVAHNLPAQTCTNASYGTVNLPVVPSVGIFDIIQLCNTVKSTCRNCNTRTPGTFTPGIEVVTFQGTIDLSSTVPSSCCWISIGSAQCCRNSANGTLQSPGSLYFFSELQLNICASANNNGPIFFNTPQPVSVNGGDYMYNIGAFDADGDSLSYRLGATKIARGTSAPYAIPFSDSVPFPYLGYPAVSPPLQAPSGIQLNPQTGQIQFRPSGVFLTNLVIEVLEWKRINNVPTLMSISSRDIQLYSLNQATSNLPTIKVYDKGKLTENNTYNVYHTTQKCFNIIADSSGTILNDTTDIELISSSPSSLTITRSYNVNTRHINGPKLDSLRVCINSLSSNLNTIIPHFLIMKSKNRLCPVPTQTYRTLSLKLYDLPKGFIAKQPVLPATLSSASFRKTNISPTNPDSTIWYLETSPGSNNYTIISMGSDTTNTILINQPGFHKIRASIYCDDGIRVNIVDSIKTNDIGIAAKSITPATCFGDSTGRVVMQKYGGTGNLQVSLQRFGTSYLPYVKNWSVADTFFNVPAGTYFLKIRDSQNKRDSVVITVNNASAQFTDGIPTLNHINCNGDSTGSITAVFNGGAPFGLKYFSKDSLTWQNSNTFSNLKASHYKIFVRDTFGCRASQAFVLTQPTILSVTAGVSQPIVCKGDSSARITLQAFGGTTPYQAKFGAGNFGPLFSFGNLKAGIYNIEVRDNKGCLKPISVTINEPNSVFTANASVTNPLCNAQTGSVTFTAQGGAKPYQFWRFGGTPSSDSILKSIPAGTYTFYAKDSFQCLLTFNITINNPPVLNLSHAKKEIRCFGDSNGSITLLANGGVKPFQYNINGGNYISDSIFTNLKGGSYNLTVKDSVGCIKSLQTNLVARTPLSTTINTTPEYCLGAKNGTAKATVSGGVSPYSSAWLLNPPISGLQVSGLSTGYYFFSVADSMQCQKLDSVFIPVQLPFEGEKICGVSIIPSSQHTQLTWNKTSGKKVFGYRVFYQVGLTGTPIALATIPVSASPIIIDSVSPKNQLVLYGISALDSCGNASPLSVLNAAPFLEANRTGNNISLNWNYQNGVTGLTGFQLYKSANNGPFVPLAFFTSNTNSYIDTLSGIANSTYYLEAIYAPTCANNFRIYSNKVTLLSNSVLDVNKHTSGFSLYPNPAQQSVTVKSLHKQPFTSVQIRSIEGKLIETYAFQQPLEEASLQLPQLSKGLYHLFISNEGKTGVTLPLMIE